jgi:hypothetical protein
MPLRRSRRDQQGGKDERGVVCDGVDGRQLSDMAGDVRPFTSSERQGP